MGFFLNAVFVSLTSVLYIGVLLSIRSTPYRLVYMGFFLNKVCRFSPRLVLYLYCFTWSFLLQLVPFLPNSPSKGNKSPSQLVSFLWLVPF